MYWSPPRRKEESCGDEKLVVVCRIFKDEPGDFSGDYLNPMEFCECTNVVHEPETCSTDPAYPSYPAHGTSYPTSTS